MANNNTKVSGVYEIRNTVNGKRYVGSSSKIEIRIREHKSRLTKGNHKNRHLQNAWNLYGAGCFVFSIIEYCEVEIITEREQFYIDTWNPEYNIAINAQHAALGLRISDEHKKKIGASKVGNKYWLGRHHSEETKSKLSKARSGKSMPEQTIEKIKTALKGNKYRLGIPHTDEAKKKIGEAGKGRTPWNKGKSSWNKGKPSPKKGTKISDEIKQKISESKKKWWKEKKLADG
jgi:group I intron endonuclease